MTQLKHLKDNVISNNIEENKMQFNLSQRNLIQSVLDDTTTLDKRQLYKQNNASKFILDILEKQEELRNAKKWGVMMENVAQVLLGLDDSENSEHDKIYNGHKIEIKTSTMLNKHLEKGRHTFQYNSVRLDYDYDYLLLQNVNLNSLDYYLISKKKLKTLNLGANQKMIKKDIIQMINFDKIKDYVISITDKNIDSILN